jgi:chromosome segregation ATPase
MNETLDENDKLKNRVKELEKRETDYIDRESTARKELLSVKLNYENGLTREEKEKLQSELLLFKQQLEEKSLETFKYKELLDISQNQLSVVQEFKNNFETELKELREYCNKLESRSEDEILIGRLQRQLISTKASYKSFVRKYHSLRENVRKREIALRILENSLNEKEKELFQEKEKSSISINSLKKALKIVKNTIVQSTPNLMETTINTGLHQSGTGTDIKDKKVQVRANNAWGKNRYYTLGLGEKLVEISEKVETLAELAENSVQKAVEKDQETKNLQNIVEDLETEKSVLIQRLHDLTNFSEPKSSSSKQSQQQVANRLISLSEEIRISKLNNLQQKRSIQAMREEIKHLKNMNSKMETDMIELEKDKIEMEVTKSIFFEKDILARRKKKTLQETNLLNIEADDQDLGENEMNSDEEYEDLFNLNNVASINRSAMNAELNQSLSKLSLEMNMKDIQGDEFEESKKKIQALNEQVFSTKRELADVNLRHNSFVGQFEDMKNSLTEKEDQLAYYERILFELGRSDRLIRNRDSSAPRSSTKGNRGHNDYRIMPEEQEKLQEAASATIGSLKSIIEEKNRIIDKLREKVDEMTAESLPNNKSKTDKRVDDLLEEIANDEDRRRTTSSARSTLPTPGKHDPLSKLHQDHVMKLQDQLQSADEIIQEKDRTLRQLETRLATEMNARERAENRCGECLNEIEAMKQDLTAMYNQLREKDHQVGHLMPPRSPKVPSPSRNRMDNEVSEGKYNESLEMEDIRTDNIKLTKRNKELEKILKSKEEKMKNYREIIVKLKDEFIKIEEEKVATEFVSRRNQSNNDDDRTQIITPAELQDLKDKITHLHHGLKAAKTDLEKAKKQREKLHHEKQLATEEIIKLNEELQKKEQQLVFATNMTNKFKRDLEDAKRKEVRLKERLHDNKPDATRQNKDSENESANGLPKNIKDAYFKAKDQIQHLETENELLRAQIAAYGKNINNEALVKEFREYSTGYRGEESKHEVRPDRTQSGGYILGSSVVPPSGEDYKQQLHQKWELEKKMQKRIGQLEKKVNELTTDNEDLKGQLLKTRDNLQNVHSAKEEIQKKMHSATKTIHETKRITVQEINDLEQANSKIFQLEEELNTLRRKADVEQINQIRTLTQQLSACHAKLKSLEFEIIDSEDKRKRYAAERVNPGTVSRTQAIRESEERFLKEEKLKDEAQHLQRMKLELETHLLERDNKILETRFDLESTRHEVDRLHRRNAELELAFRTLQSIANNNVIGGKNPSNPYQTVSTLNREEERMLTMPIGAIIGEGPSSPMRSHSAGGNRPSHIEASKREQELEHVIETLKKIIEKFRNENDRLKRGIGVTNNNSSSLQQATSTAPTTGVSGVLPDVKKLQEKFQQEKKKNEKLENDYNSLLSKCQQYESENSKFNLKINSLNSLKKQLKNKEGELIVSNNEIVQLRLENESHIKKCHSLEEKIRDLSSQIQILQQQLGSSNVLSSNQSGPTGRNLNELNKQLTQQLTENDLMRKEITELRKKLTLQTSEIMNLRENYLSQSQTSQRGRGGENLSSTVDSRELNRLVEENRKLKEELSAFDLDFFEEIENLKFAHAEAVRKLRQYESGTTKR